MSDVELGIRNAFGPAAQMAENFIAGLNLPSVMYRPKLSLDGDQWCALYGENIQDGVAGFGASPSLAMMDFNAAWYKRIASREVKDGE